jgi:hypothetical protein
MLSGVLERDAGSGGEVLLRLRHEHLRGTGQGAHAGADHHAEASNVIALDRDLAGVQPRPYLDSERANGRGDRRRTPYPACWPVERREEPVAHRLDLTSAVASNQ